MQCASKEERNMLRDFSANGTVTIPQHEYSDKNNENETRRYSISIIIHSLSGRLNGATEINIKWGISKPHKVCR